MTPELGFRGVHLRYGLVAEIDELTQEISGICEMSYVRKILTGEAARKLARSGSISGRVGRTTRFSPWWPEDICDKIEKIIWTVYSMGEVGEDWHQFVAYDSRGQIVGTHRMEVY